VKDALGAVQSVLLLGGSSEIGVSIAKALVSSRARTVLLAGRDEARMRAPAAELRDAGADTVGLLHFDADDLESHPAFVDEAFSRQGDIDLVVVAFGLLGGREPRDRDQALAVAATNYAGAVSVLLPVASRLEAQGHGTIVVLSSVAASRARRSNFHYGASKAGLDAFAQGLGDSLAGRGVSVMVVRPGFVRTKMTAGLTAAPLSTTPERVAEGVVRGLRTGAEIVWVPPPLRYVMLALGLAPRALFRRLPV
jgi:decaprenylphospho-beta-D-erythro-pentofuranosid-2-ulose 2-reductase